MKKFDINQKTAQQWLKMATIPLLLLVLVVVLCWPSEESDAAVEPVSLAADSPHAVVPQLKTDARNKWPAARLEDVIAFSPFEPKQMPQPDRTAELALLELASEPADAHADASNELGKSVAPPRTLAPGTLQAIYFDYHGAAALLDSKVFRVGDTLPNGRRIAEIKADGIRLEGT